MRVSLPRKDRLPPVFAPERGTENQATFLSNDLHRLAIPTALNGPTANSHLQPKEAQMDRRQSWKMQPLDSALPLR